MVTALPRETRTLGPVGVEAAAGALPDAASAMALAASGRGPGAGNAASTTSGPSVRVARGNSVTIVPVGAK